MDARPTSELPKPRKLPVLLKIRDLTPAPVSEPVQQEEGRSELFSHMGALRRERRRRQISAGSTGFKYSHGFVAAAVVLVGGLGYFSLRGGANKDPVADQAWETDALSADLSPPAVTFGADSELWEQGKQPAGPAVSLEPSGGTKPFSNPTSDAPYQAAASPRAANAAPPLASPPSANRAELPLENTPFANQTHQPSFERNGPETPTAYPTTGVQYPTTSAAQPRPVATAPYPTTKY